MKKSISMTTLAMVLLLLLLVAGQGQLQAGISQWESRGPTLLANVKVLYAPNRPVGTPAFWAGTAGPGEGMYLGQPGGPVSWGVRNTGLGNHFVNCLACYPSGLVVWAGTLEGLYKSTDGNSWVHVDALGTSVITAIATTETNPGIDAIRSVYVGTSEGKVYLSRDLGNNWNEVGAGGLPGHPISALAATPSEVFAGDNWGMVYRWRSNTQWSLVSDGAHTTTVTCLAIDPLVPTTVYAGYNSGLTGSTRGVYKSVDDGQTWAPAGLNSRNVQVLYFDPMVKTTLYVGMEAASSGNDPVLYKTDNGGAMWVILDNGIGRAVSVCSLTMFTGTTVPTWPAGTLMAGLSCGRACVSTNAGQTWQWTMKDVEPCAMFGLGPMKKSSYLLYAGDGDANVFRSGDKGKTWSKVSGGSSPMASYAEVLLVDPNSAGTTPTIFAGSHTGTIYRSTSGGANWDARGNMPGPVNCLAYSPLNSSQMYAGCTSNIASGYTLYRSTNAGTDWTTNGDLVGFVHGVAGHPTVNNTVYLAMRPWDTDEAAFMKSTNAAMNWTAPSPGLGHSNTAYCLAIHPSSSQTIYAGMFLGGVWRSQNGGTNWAAWHNGMDNYTVIDLAINPLYPKNILAVTDTAGVFRTTDGGLNWSPANLGLTDFHIRHVALDAQNPSIAYLTTDAGVFYRNFANDVNMDGYFNAMDLVLAFQVYTGAALSQAVDPAAADVNDDGRVNPLDLVLMQLDLVSEVTK